MASSLLAATLIAEWIAECNECIGVVVTGDGVSNGLSNADSLTVGWSEAEI